jgi:hypothetical protein
MNFENSRLNKKLYLSIGLIALMIEFNEIEVNSIYALQFFGGVSSG